VIQFVYAASIPATGATLQLAALFIQMVHFVPIFNSLKSEELSFVDPATGVVALVYT
jgi:hypothetical protein